MAYTPLAGVLAPQIDSAYQRALYGTSPTDYTFLVATASQSGGASFDDQLKAGNAVTDLQARGWYGGRLAAPYLNDLTSQTVNHASQQISSSGLPVPISTVPSTPLPRPVPITAVPQPTPIPSTSLTGGIDAAYNRAMSGTSYADFAYLEQLSSGGSATAADTIRAQKAVADLLARGWYGGHVKAPYLGDNYSTTVNHDPSVGGTPLNIGAGQPLPPVPIPSVPSTPYVVTDGGSGLPAGVTYGPDGVPVQTVQAGVLAGQIGPWAIGLAIVAWLVFRKKGRP